MNEDLRTEAWTRLVSGRSIAKLGLPLIDGRADLRGFVAGDPARSPALETGSLRVERLSNITVIRGAEWRNLDFTGARLGHLRFFDCVIEGCCFDEAHCRDWRMWGSRVDNTTFRGADLRDAALGGVDHGKRNAFSNVDFSGADLRGTAHHSSDMEDCVFAKTKLSKVDFQGTVFVRCRFEGDLHDVLFYRHAFRGEAYPPNEMLGVDFKLARFHYVEFRHLDMHDVEWPTADDHLVIEDYPAALDRVLAFVKDRPELGYRRLAAVFGSNRKWVGPQQAEGVINLSELRTMAGPESVDEILRLLRPS